MYTYLFLIIITYIFIRLLIKFSKKLGFQDIPNHRSSHAVVVPRGAGIGFIFAIFLVFMLFEQEIFFKYKILFLSLFLVFLIGLLDDHRDAPPKAKFLIIIISSILLFFSDIYIDSFGIYFGYNIKISYIALPFSIFVIVGITNAFNLIDGLDGLCASISLVIIATFSYIGYVYQDIFIFKLSSYSLVAILIFLLFNWNPAKIFMGDTGSLSIGFIVSVLSILSLKYIHPTSILFITAIPIVDTLVVMIRRIRRGKSPFSPDKKHIHHILYVFFSRNVKKTVLFLSLMQLLFCFFGYISSQYIKLNPSGVLSFSLLISFIFIIILSYTIFTAMDRRQKFINRLIKKRSK